MHLVADAGRSLGTIVVDAAHALARHWPALLVIYLLGAAARAGFLWLAVEVSDLWSLGGTLLIPLASISMLVAMVLMLRAVAPALPLLRESVGPDRPRQRLRADITVAVQVLIPFLAVYASQGMLAADARSAIHDATADEWMNSSLDALDFGRFSDTPDSVYLVIVIAALVVRKVIAGFGLSRRHLGIAAFAGYLEALWMVTLATAFTRSIDSLKEWVGSRAVIVRLTDALQTAIDVLGPLGRAAQAAIDQIAAVISSMGALVIVPVAWMAVGATVYGTSLPDASPLATPEEVTRRLHRIPNPMRRAASQVVEPVVSPIQNALTAIGRIAVAGVLPMVFLCLVLAGASHLRMLTARLLHALIGPQPQLVAYSLTPIADMAARGVYTVVAVVLLAAAVNTIAARRLEQAPEDA
jgi:hypothetical protein